MITRTTQRRSILIALSLTLLIAITLSLAIGSRVIPFADVIAALTNPRDGDNAHLVVLTQRLPRTIIAVVAGAALAIAGTLMQGLTRNPLADPGLLGLNAGASLAVLLSIVVLGWSNPAIYVWAAVLGAILAAAIVYGIAARGGEGPTPSPWPSPEQPSPPVSPASPCSS